MRRPFPAPSSAGSDGRGIRPAAAVALAAAALFGGCLLGAGGGLVNEGGAGASMEMEMDRPGGDYDAFALSAPRPEGCRAACAADARCLAYTYVRPGDASASARCHLKKEIPNAVTSGCCVSGVKGVVASPPPPFPPSPSPLSSSTTSHEIREPGARRDDTRQSESERE